MQIFWQISSKIQGFLYNIKKIDRMERVPSGRDLVAIRTRSILNPYVKAASGIVVVTGKTNIETKSKM